MSVKLSRCCCSLLMFVQNIQFYLQVYILFYLASNLILKSIPFLLYFPAPYHMIHLGMQREGWNVRDGHPPLKIPYIFFCLFKSFLLSQSNLNKWRGATPPSVMVLFLLLLLLLLLLFWRFWWSWVMWLPMIDNYEKRLTVTTPALSLLLSKMWIIVC